MRAGNERLLDILEAIGEIERYAVRGRETFLQDELVQVWMIHHLQIIGEAAACLRILPRGS
ncbi:HepT-like ribonuclease domain-containing protein [Methanoculleus caldifontis]|uniref:HepT-like ribonuclease domain-containing protein n=1 Tax=Methanoculleus caldifontis TaxID=2651577 RepID=UPI002936DA9D|nr:HepT-like ribonuclease domain-containing protein [Methanoculleus sp. Wushi-C6]